MCVCVCVCIHALSMHALRILSLPPFLNCGPGLDHFNLFASSSAEYTVCNSREHLIGSKAQPRDLDSGIFASGYI